MATSHPRIGVTKDRELAAALERTRAQLDPSETRSEAGHVRRLALIGAGALSAGGPQARAALDRQRVLDRPGVRPATRDLLAELQWLDGAPVDEERRGTRALEWVRGGR